jgi:hypothetical protein
MAAVPAMTVADEPACLNCGGPLTGPFCARCGQRRAATDVTLAEFLRDTTHELTNWDGKIPSTLKVLFLKPGQLTLDFLEGRRARWLAPLRVYLLCSVSYFLIGPIVEAITHRNVREFAKVIITNPDGSTTIDPRERERVERGLPARIFGIDRLERAAANGTLLNRNIEGTLSKAMFLLLPMLAVFTRLAWRRRVPRYPAHLYLALHIHAAWFGVLVLLTLVKGFVTSDLLGGIIGLAAFVYTVWYGLVAARTVFKESWPRTIAKVVAVGGAYSICLFVMSLVLLAYVVLLM